MRSRLNDLSVAMDAPRLVLAAPRACAYRNAMLGPASPLLSLQAFVRRKLWRQDIHPTSHIAATAHIDRTWPKGIPIAAGAVIHDYAVILAHDMSRGLYLDTRIGEGAQIGIRAIVMPGVTVGAGAVVDPGAIVTADVPAGKRVRGNPAREVAA